MADVHDESGTWCGRYLAMKPKHSPPLAAWYLGAQQWQPDEDQVTRAGNCLTLLILYVLAQCC